jgi:hypothetical protein
LRLLPYPLTECNEICPRTGQRRDLAGMPGIADAGNFEEFGPPYQTLFKFFEW